MVMLCRSERLSTSIVLLFIIVFFYFFLLLTFFTTVLSQRNFSHGYSSQGKPAASESRYPTYDARWVFYSFHNPPNSGMDYGIFNVRTDVNACDCTRGCKDTIEESALKVDFGTKIPCRTGESDLR